MSPATQWSGDHLVAERLACRRGGRIVFAELGFTIGSGDVLVLSGPNGSGKSSLLRLLATLLTPESGRLVWRGSPVGEDAARYRAALHYVGHLDATKPALTPREVLAFWAALRQTAAPAIDSALATFDLERIADWPCRWLSAGQRRRLGLARLIAAPAPLWLLDEPSAALDSDSEDRLTAAMIRHRAAGGMVVVATHQPLALSEVQSLDLEDYSVSAETALDLEW